MILIREKLIHEKYLEISEEIMAVAKAKNITEKEVWQMGQMEFYNTLRILENYNKKIMNKN